MQQPIKPPFQQNYVTQESEDEGENVGEENHFFTPDDLPTYITEEEELIGNAYTPQDEHYILSNDVVLQEESEEYQRGYLHALSAQQGQQRQLRNRTIPINPIQKRAKALVKNGAAVPQKKGKEISDPSSTQSVLASKMDQPSSVPKDDQLELIFGLALNGESPESDVPPFYISLRIHDYVLHNAMFDSGASHNLMPKAIMENLGLDIT